MSCVLAGDVNETGNFTQLNTIIDATNDDSIDLADDYVHVEGDDDLFISKSIRISGNNHTIDANESQIVIDANDSSVIFEDVGFLNHQFEISNTSNLNVTFINCYFKSANHDLNASIEMQHINNETHTTGNISETVKELALSIIGDSKDLDAAYKLAVWVGENITHETAPGFYQTPDVTLQRRLGNCCSQTDLFLQMCVAIGLNETHKLYYVHVGFMEFGYRHFFAIIDNLLVDVDAKPNSPWGHAYVGKYGFYQVTEYPYIPLPREYES